jgi:cation diffusion facilitator CzcD-associated flavoprotein CzcO
VQGTLEEMGSVLRIPFAVKRVAIIGAGPSGLAAAKFLLAENHFDKVDILEQQGEVGGVWNYTSSISDSVTVPSTTPHVAPDRPIVPKDGGAPIFTNPMYDRLYTNIPKGLMGFSDQAFKAESLLFPTREDVQEYLIRYSQDVRHLISFSTQVQNISYEDNNGFDAWKVTSKSTITSQERTTTYDAVIVANGHYSVPFIPAVPGIEEFYTTYPSIISHSKIFRSPDSFANKKVIVVGNAASGLDIGTQISKVCRKPLLNSVRQSSGPNPGEDKEEVPVISEYMVDVRGVKFEDGRIEENVDAIVYCTGYFYSYPFLESLSPPIITTGRRAVGLYQQVFNIRYHTLAFTALAQKVIPFPISEVQCAAIAKVWSNKLDLPSVDEMHLWERKRVKEYGDGTSFHYLGYPKDAEYLNELHDWVKGAKGGFSKEPAYWDAEQKWVRSIFSEIRKKFHEDGEKAKTLKELGFEYEKRVE